MTDHELIRIAEEAKRNAYAPYSRFSVGAALECRDGSVITGCNVENAAYGCTICAERTALVKAISEGKREFKRMAIIGSTDEYCVPCGSCRQVLSEFSADLELLAAKNDGHYVCYKLSELLPKQYGKVNLKL